MRKKNNYMYICTFHRYWKFGHLMGIVYLKAPKETPGILGRFVFWKNNRKHFWCCKSVGKQTSTFCSHFCSHISWSAFKSELSVINDIKWSNFHSLSPISNGPPRRRASAATKVNRHNWQTTNQRTEKWGNLIFLLAHNMFNPYVCMCDKIRV